MKTKFYSLLLVSMQLHVLGCCGAEGTEKEKFVAHEWGTFTSVQGADGIQMEWNPLITSELPKFVYDLNRPAADIQRQRYSAYASKAAMSALQRMEASSKKARRAERPSTPSSDGPWSGI